MRGERLPSIPRIAPTSLTTASFRWLHAEAWDDRQINAFTQALLAPPAGMYAPVPFVKARHRGTPQTVGRWLLEAVDGTPLAAAEAQMHATHFTTVVLTVSAPEGWGGATSFAALTLLVSGVMLLARADLVRLVATSEAASQSLAALNLGPAATVWTPLAAAVRMTTPLSGLRLPLVTVTPHEWWETAHGAADRKTLAYLDKRLRKDGRGPAETARRLGWVSRLAQIWRRR